ncbi:MAG: biotin--[acetyl-CoA-carboxylase] ligase [Bacteroidales bacterium]|nr:biotin--[acetyl-CoA-carboxylase] ligase [Bacteroidales bacterium]
MPLIFHHFALLDSTNAYLQRQQTEHDIRNWVVSTDEQCAGKGMGNNGWESEAGKNLTFSLAVDMSFLPAERQFLLSEAVPLGIIEVLDTVLPKEKISIKWPNDIVYDGHKLAGILINSTIKTNIMDVSIIGIGLNVNQMRFQDWPTHPISMKIIKGEDYDLQPLLEQIAENIIIKVEQLRSNPTSIEQDYLKRLFRYRTWAEYEIEGKTLRLFMTGIDAFGRLQLVDEQQELHQYEIKQIKFLV